MPLHVLKLSNYPSYLSAKLRYDEKKLGKGGESLQLVEEASIAIEVSHVYLPGTAVMQVTTERGRLKESTYREGLLASTTTIWLRKTGLGSDQVLEESAEVSSPEVVQSEAALTTPIRHIQISLERLRA